MYQKILVPLEGSEMAECVLPHVEAIAQGCNAGSVLFVRTAEPVTSLTGGEELALGADTWRQIEAEIGPKPRDISGSWWEGSNMMA